MTTAQRWKTTAETVEDELLSVLREVFQHWEDAVADRSAARGESHAEAIWSRDERARYWSQVKGLVKEMGDCGEQRTPDFDEIESTVRRASDNVEEALNSLRLLRR